MKKEHIKRTEALAAMEVHETPTGEPNIYSIKFVTSDGELVYLPHAKSCGLRASMTKNRMRGVQPCTERGANTGHVYPVSIDNLIEFNGQTIQL